ncbi:alpha/beta-hydrolase [Coccomyxa subellipsoidea C-169]|uniref:Alpha/beta-hydrolase n=1 Tax=Coccomyxa subellipsoidea (strain C-169) TaxID=574566 RepID=I0YLG4_COCSC|nr:alpha/beta-hydrolase [Coccomyxa subellipsoidea C-169]EIE19233.1 alpha/beta-hydrolase [Coccomyxa subellipsoidea C-169]|eukprot:XP_005643777.1 alpha/beta-hydrolase [Coccomyxa subellipsoidea C-169]
MHDVRQRPKHIRKLAGVGVAAVGASVAVYFFSRRITACGFGGATDGNPIPGVRTSGAFQNAHKAPNNWLEALFFFAEALRFMYGETLGKWRTADLLIGLAYLAQRGTEEHPASDIAEHGEIVGLGLSQDERSSLVVELRTVQRYMRYCRALRERHASAQAAVLRGMGIEAKDIRVQVPMARMLKPSYAIVCDRQLKTVVLAVRGTHSLKDMFTSLTGASKPHHIVDGAGVVLGYAHFGMLAGARWLMHETAQPLRDALAENPGYCCKIVGHSLGGGTAAMLTMMLRDAAPEFADATCLAIACPACMTVELARSCAGYVTTVINSTDIVPTISRGAADALREDVVRSAWYEAFRADMRSNLIVRAVESSITGVGSATVWTTSCYQRRSPAKRRSSEAVESVERAGVDTDMVGSGTLSGASARDSMADVEFARNWIPKDLQELDMGASSGSFSEEDGPRRSQLPSEQELLEGMQAVQAAVEAAEQEDGILGSPTPVLRRPDRPANSGVFTGVAGQDTAFGMEAPDWDSAQAEHSEEQWKRMTYPAGRILHLVPARLGNTWQTPHATFEQQTLHTSMAGVDGSLVMVGEAVTTEAEELDMPQKKEIYVLLENVPQEAYSRVKLCNSMVADHFIPAYLASMDAVIEGLQGNH